MILASGIMGGGAGSALLFGGTGTSKIIKAIASGTTLTPHGNDAYGSSQDAARNGGLIIAVNADDKKLQRSNNYGATFSVDSADFTSDSLQTSVKKFIAYDATLGKWFIAAMLNSGGLRIYSSSDGVTFSTAATFATATAVYQLGAGGGRVLVIYQDSGQKLAFSSDGTTYTSLAWASVNPDGTVYSKPKYGNGKFVIGSNGATGTRVAYASVSDLTAWSQPLLTSGPVASSHAVAYSTKHSRWVSLFTQAGTLVYSYYSTDATSWTVSSSYSISSNVIIKDVLPLSAGGFIGIWDDTSGGDDLPIFNADGTSSWAALSVVGTIDAADIQCGVVL